MNTPRQKPLRRFGMLRKRRNPHVTPDGQYSGGLWSEPHALLVGMIATSLPQVEEMMIQFMALLLGEPGAPARQIFRALNSEQARMQVMTALLEEAPRNREKGPEYEAIIAAFGSVKKKRNAFVHGIWNTHDETKRVFLSEASPDETYFLQAREVSTKELQATLDEIHALFGKIIDVLAPDRRKPPSPETLPQQPDERND